MARMAPALLVLALPIRHTVDRSPARRSPGSQPSDLRRLDIRAVLTLGGRPRRLAVPRVMLAARRPRALSRAPPAGRTAPGPWPSPPAEPNLAVRPDAVAERASHGPDADLASAARNLGAAGRPGLVRCGTARSALDPKAILGTPCPAGRGRPG